MSTTVDVQIAPNKKYRQSIDRHGDQFSTGGYGDPASLHDVEAVSWDDIEPSSDPDLLAKIATYFEGMDPVEPTERLRAKCRLLDVQVYLRAQMAARETLE